MDMAYIRSILAEDGIPEEEYQRVKRKTDWILLPLVRGPLTQEQTHL